MELEMEKCWARCIDIESGESYSCHRHPPRRHQLDQQVTQSDTTRMTQRQYFTFININTSPLCVNCIDLK